MYKKVIYGFAATVLLFSCAKSRIKEHAEWAKFYEKYGIQHAGILLRDNNHESIHYYNKEQVTRRYLPASTFKVFLSLVALETGVAPDDRLVIKWDSIHRRPDWDKDMDLREALKTSSEPYFRELARRIGPTKMQHYIDTVKYGNMLIAGHIDEIWENDTLRISADEQTGFLKRLYFAELPFAERSQRIVKTMMLQEETHGYNLYYKTGRGEAGGKIIYWVTGFCERIEHVKEPKGSMNNTDVRNYPYFFAQNFELPIADSAKDWRQIGLDALHEVLKDYGAIPKQ